MNRFFRNIIESIKKYRQCKNEREYRTHLWTMFYNNIHMLDDADDIEKEINRIIPKFGFDIDYHEHKQCNFTEHKLEYVEFYSRYKIVHTIIYTTYDFGSLRYSKNISKNKEKFDYKGYEDGNV